MIYLAGPYTHTDNLIKEKRYQQHMRHLAFLLNAGEIVFSPIVHWHVVAATYNLPSEWAFWRRLDIAILERCTKLVVLKLPGWQDSVGVIAEIKHANLTNKPIEYHNEH